MRIAFLGTNGWYDSPTGNTLCILLETQQEYIILDAGSGLYKLDEYLTGEKRVYLFLSHFHLDHLFGIHSLSKFKFPYGLVICGQPGVGKMLGRILDIPFTIPIRDLPFKCSFIELPEQKGLLPFKVESLPLLHSSYTLGYQFQVDNKVITFCTDTGYCENAVRLSEGADLLLLECSLKAGKTDEGWPHLNPELAARTAKEANAKLLVLIHFDANEYDTIEKREQARAEARKIFPNVIYSFDGLRLEV